MNVTNTEYANQVAVGENHVTIIQPYTPTRSTIPQYLRQRRASKCKTGPQPEAVDKPPDQVGRMVNSHCTGLGLGPVQGPYEKCRNV